MQKQWLSLESKTIIMISLLSFYSVRGQHQFKALCCSSTTSKFSFSFNRFNCSSQSTQPQPLARSLSCRFFSFVFNVKSLSNCASSRTHTVYTLRQLCSFRGPCSLRSHITGAARLCVLISVNICFRCISPRLAVTEQPC